MTEKPVLVTGGTRSGTTWVGRTMAKSSFVRYIHEPFNLRGRQCTCGLGGNRWFSYISTENERIWERHLAHLIEYPFNLINLKSVGEEVRIQGSLKAKLRTIKNFSVSLFTNRAIVKDPLAIFSAEWLARRFNMDVLVLIRHPAGFVSSYKRLNWSHQFSEFLDQSALMREYLYPFEPQIRDYVLNEHDIVDQAALLWRLIYSVVFHYRKIHSDWTFIRHEDLSREPIRGFQNLFLKLNLKFSPKVKNFIEETTNYRNEVDPENPYLIKLNSARNIWKWKDNLSPEEIECVKNAVADVSCNFYTDRDW